MPGARVKVCEVEEKDEEVLPTAIFQPNGLPVPWLRTMIRTAKSFPSWAEVKSRKKIRTLVLTPVKEAEDWPIMQKLVALAVLAVSVQHPLNSLRVR
jgi:hypothetical protein